MYFITYCIAWVLFPNAKERITNGKLEKRGIINGRFYVCKKCMHDYTKRYRATEQGLENHYFTTALAKSTLKSPIYAENREIREATADSILKILGVL